MVAPLLLFIGGFGLGGASSLIADPLWQGVAVVGSCVAVLAAIALSFRERP